MASSKITNNLKVHGESTTQKYTDAEYASDTERVNGVQTGTPIKSKIVNTGLRNASLVAAAFIEALKNIVPSDNDITSAITVGANTTFAALSTAIAEALVKIKVEKALLADNVVSGALVEETTRARESKQGYGISLSLNSKLVFKGTWAGSYKNNDVVYYGTGDTLKGFYIIKGLSTETTSVAAGTLTIASGDTPTTHAANLTRVTYETVIGTNTSLTKTDLISDTSTTNQLATALAVYNFAQSKVAAGTENDILIRTAVAGVLSTLTKVTSITSGSTDVQIPTAKSVFDFAQAKIAAGSGILTQTSTAGVLNTLTKTTTITTGHTDNELPTTKAVKDFGDTKVNSSIVKTVVNDSDSELPTSKATRTYVNSRLPYALNNVVVTGTPNLGKMLFATGATTAQWANDMINVFNAIFANGISIPLTSNETYYIGISSSYSQLPLKTKLNNDFAGLSPTTTLLGNIVLTVPCTVAGESTVTLPWTYGTALEVKTSNYDSVGPSVLGTATKVNITAAGDITITTKVTRIQSSYTTPNVLISLTALIN